MKDYDYFYNRETLYYGENPSPELVNIVERFMIKPCKVADVGAGEGRDSVYLAKLGFDVIAIEPNRYGYQKIKKRASAENLTIQSINADLFSGLSLINNVSFIILETVLNEFDKNDLSSVFENVYSKLEPNGYLYASVFTKSDPGYIDAKSSIASECTGTLKYHFDDNELKTICERYFTTVDYNEFIYDDLSHGNPHKHAVAVILARKAGRL